MGREENIEKPEAAGVAPSCGTAPDGEDPDEIKAVYIAPTEKLKTYLRYFGEDILNGDFASIVSSIRYLLWRKTPRENRIIKSRMGLFYCRANTTDFMFANYAYELRVKQFINRVAADYQVYMDIGSCIGDYSVWLGTKGLRCHAFEPVLENFHVLEENIRLNQLTELVTLHNYGLGKDNRKVTFEIRPDNKGASKLDRRAETAEGNVEIRRLDDISSTLNISPEDKVLIKIDVEGMELDVLAGGSEFLAGLRNLIIISEATLSHREAIMNVLNKIGSFTYHEVDELNFAAIKTA